MQMTLPRNVSLTYEAKYIPPESRSPAQKTFTHAITAKVAALPETFASIMKVVYLPLPQPAFSNANYTADSAIDNFAVSWVVWGGFDLRAKVYFKDGQVIDLPLKRISLTTEGDTMQMYKFTFRNFIRHRHKLPTNAPITSSGSSSKRNLYFVHRPRKSFTPTYPQWLSINRWNGQIP